MPEQDNIIPNTHYVSPDGREYPVGLNGRIDFSKISGHLDLPNLVEIQTNSYADFVNKGIDEVFKEVFPIVNNAGNISVEYVSSRLEDPTSTPAECREHSSDYSSKLKVTLRLRFTDTEEMKEKELYMGDLPKMTESGTFIINGAVRAVISQIVRSPGAYFKDTYDKSIDAHIYNGEITPNRGTCCSLRPTRRASPSSASTASASSSPPSSSRPLATTPRTPLSRSSATPMPSSSPSTRIRPRTRSRP